MVIILWMDELYLQLLLVNKIRMQTLTETCIYPFSDATEIAAYCN